MDSTVLQPIRKCSLVFWQEASLCLRAEFLLSQDTLKTIKLILLPNYIFKDNQAHTITILYIQAHVIIILYILA